MRGGAREHAISRKIPHTAECAEGVQSVHGQCVRRAERVRKRIALGSELKEVRSRVAAGSFTFRARLFSPKRNRPYIPIHAGRNLLVFRCRKDGQWRSQRVEEGRWEVGGGWCSGLGTALVLLVICLRVCVACASACAL